MASSDLYQHRFILATSCLRAPITLAVYVDDPSNRFNGDRRLGRGDPGWHPARIALERCRGITASLESRMGPARDYAAAEAKARILIQETAGQSGRQPLAEALGGRLEGLRREVVDLSSSGSRKSLLPPQGPIQSPQLLKHRPLDYDPRMNVIFGPCSID